MKTLNLLVVAATALASASFVDYSAAQAQRPGAAIRAAVNARREAAANRLGLKAQDPAAVDDAFDASAAQVPATTLPAARTNATQIATPGTAQTGAAQPGTGTARTAAPAKKSDGSEFIIPENATVDELIAQADALSTTEVAFETEDEYNVWLDKMLATNGKIADKILASKTTDEQFVRAVSLKGQVLCYRATLDAKALAQLDKFATALEKNKRVQSLDEGRDAALAFRGVYLQAKVADVVETQGTAADMKKAMSAVARFIAANPQTADMTVDLVYPVSVLADNLKDDSLPEQIWTPIRAQLKKAGDADSLAALESLEGAIRFSQLVGAPFEWFGRTLDGEAFDPETVKGKVVLVDFWANCDACKTTDAELAKLYAKFHEQGFEIVGYNLDSDAKNARAYLTANAIPWGSLSDLEATQAKEKSLARYYGIEEIPTLILIGGDGKVAATDVDLETLSATLDQVFAASAKQAAKAAVESNAANSSRVAGSAKIPGSTAAPKAGAAASSAAVPQAAPATGTKIAPKTGTGAAATGNGTKTARPKTR